jgi:hypothetical protein
MTENESTHDMQMISNSQWKTFFANLAQEYRGQLVSIEVGQDLLVDNPPPGKVPLLGIEYEKHKGVVISVGNDAATETHSVKSPDLVWAIHVEGEKLVAVEIIGRDGRNLILYVEP